ncbi:MAG: hypothetical protein ACOZNI_18800 [Myxococcota bacterium]
MGKEKSQAKNVVAPDKNVDPSTKGTDATGNGGGAQKKKLGEQNTKGNEAVQSQLPAASQADRASAQKAVNAWGDSASDFVDGTRQWLQGNWTEFYGRASGNPRLGWQEGEGASILNNAFGNAITTLGEGLIKKGSAAAAAALVGTAIAPGVGTVIGFVAGVIIEWAAGKLFEYVTGKSDTDDSAAQASKQTAGLIQAQNETFETQAEKGRGEVRGGRDKLQERLDQATTKQEVDSIATWAQAEKAKSARPNTKDRTLFKTLLEQWVLEHAGDEEDANKETSEAQWEGAAQEVFGKTDLDNRPDVFAWQTKNHWAGVGLNNSSTQVMIKTAQGMMKKGKDPAAEAYAGFNGWKQTFQTTKNPDALIKLIDDHHYTKHVSPEGRECIKKGQFKLDCALDLTTSDGACYVDEWEYDLHFTGKLGPGQIYDTKFGVSPD